MLAFRIIFIYVLFANYFAHFISINNLHFIVLSYLVFDFIKSIKRVSIPTILFIAIYSFVTSSSVVAYILLDSIVFDSWRMFDDLYYQKSICLLGISYASIFASIDFVKIKLTSNRPFIYIKKSFKTLILILVIISFPLLFYSLIFGDLSLMLYEGYSAFTNNRKSGDLSRFLVLSLSYFLPWLIISLCLVNFVKSNFHSKKSLFIIIISILFILVSGDRTSLSIVIIGVLIAYDFTNKLKVNIFKSLTVFFILLTLFSGIQNIRSVGFDNANADVFFDKSNDELNFIQSLPLLMSNQLQCLPKTIELIDKKIESPRYGLDIVRSLLQSVPFGNSLLKEIDFNPRERKAGIFVQPTQWISYHLNDREEMSGVGFLMIAEFFLNFGIIGVVILPFLLVLFIETKYRKLLLLRKIDASNFLIYLVVFLQIIVWIRNDSTSVIFSLLLILALSFLSNLLTNGFLNNAKK